MQYGAQRDCLAKSSRYARGASTDSAERNGKGHINVRLSGIQSAPVATVDTNRFIESAARPDTAFPRFYQPAVAASR
jgi:hypothetical protein